VKVFSYTEPREAILDYDRWYLSRKGEWQATAVAEGRRHGKTVIVHLEDVDDRDAAAELVDCEIATERDALPEVKDGNFYWADLEGLQVVHRDGTELGRVAYLMETGANDVLVTEGERERLIPFIADKVILDVDLEKGVISVDWEWD
jgi:16S rRNA processing protein RimM